MAHYKNGRAAKVGDQIVGRRYDGVAISGIVASIQPGSTSCNSQVYPLVQGGMCLTLGELLHIDDVMAASVPAPIPASEVPAQPVAQS